MNNPSEDEPTERVVSSSMAWGCGPACCGEFTTFRHVKTIAIKPHLHLSPRLVSRGTTSGLPRNLLFQLTLIKGVPLYLLKSRNSAIHTAVSFDENTG